MLIIGSVGIEVKVRFKVDSQFNDFLSEKLSTNILISEKPNSPEFELFVLLRDLEKKVLAVMFFCFVLMIGFVVI